MSWILVLSSVHQIKFKYCCNLQFCVILWVKDRAFYLLSNFYIKAQSSYCVTPKKEDLGLRFLRLNGKCKLIIKLTKC